MPNAQGHVEEDFACGYSPRPAARFTYEEPDLLVARATKAQLLGRFSDGAADLCRPVRPYRQALDLVEEPKRDPRREEAHDADGARREVTPL